MDVPLFRLSRNDSGARQGVKITVRHTLSLPPAGTENHAPSDRLDVVLTALSQNFSDSSTPFHAFAVSEGDAAFNGVDSRFRWEEDLETTIDHIERCFHSGCIADGKKAIQNTRKCQETCREFLRYCTGPRCGELGCGYYECPDYDDQSRFEFSHTGARLQSYMALMRNLPRNESVSHARTHVITIAERPNGTIIGDVNASLNVRVDLTVTNARPEFHLDFSLALCLGSECMFVAQNFSLPTENQSTEFFTFIPERLGVTEGAALSFFVPLPNVTSIVPEQPPPARKSYILTYDFWEVWGFTFILSFICGTILQYMLMKLLKLRCYLSEPLDIGETTPLLQKR